MAALEAKTESILRTYQAGFHDPFYMRHENLTTLLVLFTPVLVNSRYQ